ncbi:MAG: 5-formyltetrahydrofolate cyclo-ligase [Proteobacteria bacterium]|nr:5-formyltetrahydrofolate cyclo-ligase [Burkholderiales bacterium]
MSAPADNTLAHDKHTLRATALAARSALGGGQRATRSATITEQLLRLPAFARADTLALYLSFGAEFDTTAFVGHVLAAGRRLALPRIVDPDSPPLRHLVLHAVADIARDTRPGRWGIREPDPARCPALATAEIDLVLVPGLAFDQCGGRLGYGAGYYDRLLAGLRPDCVRVGAAFSVQQCAAVPMGAHDQPVDLLVTEQGVFATGARDGAGTLSP